MTVLFRRRAGVVLAAVATSAAVLPMQASSGAASGQEIILPPVYGNTVPNVYSVGDEAGFAWVKNPLDPGVGDVRYYDYANGAVVDSHQSLDIGDLGLVGTQLSGSARDGSVVAIDIVTGATKTLRPSGNAEFLGGTGNGWLDLLPYSPQSRLRLTDGSGIHVYPLPTLDGTPQDESVSAAARDESGAMLFAYSPSTGAHSLSYLDFATGKYTTLGPSAIAGSYQLAAENDSTLVWTDGDHIHWVPRSDLAASPGTATAPGEVGGMSLSGDNVALAFRSGKYWAIQSGPFGGSLTTVSGTGRSGSNVLPADNGGFAVYTANDVETTGLYRLAPGATTLGARLVAFGASAPLGIEASAGQLLTKLPVSAGATTGRPLNAGSDDSSLTAGAATRLVAKSDYIAPPTSSGGHNARLECDYPVSCTAVVQDGALVVATYDVPANSYWVELSGQRLLVSVMSDTETNGRPDPGYSVVIDLDTGARTTEPETNAISGENIAYILGTGEVRVRNVSTGAERTIRAPGLPAGTTGFQAGSGILHISGDWVFWSIPRGDLTNAESAAVNLRTGQHVDVPMTAHAEDRFLAAMELVDGAAAWIDPNDQSVHLFDLATGTDHVVGTAHDPYPNRDWLALTDEFVAWVAPDDMTHVLPLDGMVTAPPQYLGGITPAAVSPNGDGSLDSYRPQLDTSRPLSSWTLRLASSTGHVVRSISGAAANGGIRPAWNGRDAHGRKVADGTYRWSLSGTSPTGRIRSVAGQVRIDTQAPAATVHATSRRHIVVHWASSEAASRYTVTVSRRVHRHHHLAWTAGRRWLTRTALTHDKYAGSGLPYAVKSGQTYRFTVVAIDAAGNVSRRSSVVVKAR